MMIRLIFIDIDGTLRDSKSEISARVRKAILNLEKVGVTVVLCLGRASEEAAEVSKYCGASKVTGRFYIEIANDKILKGKAVTELINYLNIPLEDTMAIGDGYNDISMFEAVGYKVAMGNANSDLMAMADRITLSNDEGGVAVILEDVYKNAYKLN